MTPEKITELAEEAGLDISGHMVWCAVHELQTFANLVRQHTLEEAAVKCDELYYKNIGATYGEVRYGIASCAKEIRGLKT